LLALFQNPTGFSGEQRLSPSEYREFSFKNNLKRAQPTTHTNAHTKINYSQLFRVQDSNEQTQSI